MHVCFITNNFPPTICGIGDHTYQLAQQFAKKGYEVSVICRKTVKVASLNGIETFPIIESWNREGFQKAFDTLQKIIPDWVFIQYEPYSFHQKGMPLQMIPFVKRLKKENYKTLVFFHEIAIKWQFSTKLLFLSAVQRFIAHGLIYHATQGITSMAYYKLMFSPIFYDKIDIQPIGSNIKSVKHIPQHEKQGNTFKIACFGGDGAEKGYEILLKSLKKLPFAHLIFIGKGENIKQISKKQGLEQQVTVTGILNTEGVYQHLQECDIFAMVHADIRGGIGFKSGSLAAGFYAGLPILGFKGAITETHKLIHGENCFLVNEATPEAFTKAINILYSDEIFLQKLKTQSEFFYKTHLDWQILANQYEEYFGIEKIPPVFTPSVFLDKTTA